MTRNDHGFHQEMERLDDVPDNRSSSRNLADRVQQDRRRFLQGSLATAVASFFMAPPQIAMASGTASYAGLTGAKIGFRPVPPQMAADFDSVVVPEGYKAQPFFSWGDPVVRGASPWQPDASDDWQSQALQAGQNHDGMAYFSFPENPKTHGLLVINHEYINPTLHPNGFNSNKLEDGSIQRSEAEVRKEQMAHGVSVIEVKKSGSQWEIVKDSRYGRRVTAQTPMNLTGPAAGVDLLKTASDITGKRVLGTINNCAMGQTPWGTYLTCEENWKNYFVNRDPDDYSSRREHHRYGVAQGLNSKNYAWDSVDARFNATPDESQRYLGQVNEPNRFGWVVEFDPFDPESVPKKRTALGRLVRECATVTHDEEGRVAIYSGDDTRGEYVYKFVPKGRYQRGNAAANTDLLDEGTLYVAVFHEDGEGEWRALELGRYGLTPRNGFHTQADVLINARMAADIVGATPMDRPEWVAVHPASKEVYVALTNNKHRGHKPDQPVDAANPRKDNLHGQIVRWREKNDRVDATSFRWEIFLLAGDTSDAGAPEHLTGTINGDVFSSPDGLWFDPQGRLWIQTDYGDDDAQNANMGTNQMLCADPGTREVKRFLAGPRGCEVTGVTTTPDGKAMWVNIQHPGLSYPASDGKTRARSTTVLITKTDGGVIGT
ncbi:PhoX family protein [Marinobacter lacisalsi]